MAKEQAVKKHQWKWLRSRPGLKVYARQDDLLNVSGFFRWSRLFLWYVACSDILLPKTWTWDCPRFVEQFVSVHGSVQLHWKWNCLIVLLCFVLIFWRIWVHCYAAGSSQCVCGGGLISIHLEGDKQGTGPTKLTTFTSDNEFSFPFGSFCSLCWESPTFLLITQSFVRWFSKSM